LAQIEAPDIVGFHLAVEVNFAYQVPAVINKGGVFLEGISTLIILKNTLVISPALIIVPKFCNRIARRKA
jgi:uncharacterized membrane protein YkgB